MAITLADMARLKEDEYEAGIYEVLEMESSPMALLGFNTLNATTVNTRRFNALPDVGFRSRGESYTQGTVGYDVVSDSVYPLGAQITIDKMDMKDKSPFINPLSFHTEAHVKSMAFKFNAKFIKGDHATSPKEFEGLKVRIGNLAASQTIYANNSTTKLDVTDATIASSTANGFTWLNRIDQAIDACDGHSADACFTDRDVIRALFNVFRRANIQVEKMDDAKPTTVGSRKTSSKRPNGPAFIYNGVKFYDLGKEADQSTSVVPTETLDSVACRPLYFVKFGDHYLSGIQEYAMEVSKPFMMDDGVTWKTVIDWPVGLRHVHPKFASVLRGSYVAA